MPGFNPERLNEIRAIRKMTLAELALKLGVTKQAVSKYEHGKSIPSYDTINNIADVLNVPKQYLTKESINSVQDNSAIFFRTASTTTLTEKDFADCISRWGYEVLLGINSFEKIPSMNIPNFNDDLSIPEKALYLRQFWSLDTMPINNMTAVLEANGIFVFTINSSELHTDAYSRLINGIPIVVLNEHKGTAVRWRFNLAHELGHLVLHRNLSQSEIKLRENLIENEASLFASNFLLPYDTFACSVISPKLSHFLKLKQEWKVSLAAMLFNCEHCGIIDSQQSYTLQKQLSKKGWRVSEPLDDELEFEKPAYFYEQAQRHIIDRNSFVQFYNGVRLPINDVEHLCSLPKGYFDEYNNVEATNNDIQPEDEQLSLFN